MTSLPCQPWLTSTSLDDDCDAKCLEIDSAILDAAFADASEFLYECSGRRWPGVCEGTARPCARTPVGFASWHGLLLAQSGAVPDDWWWLDEWGTCGCEGLSSCTCCGLRGVYLGYAPVTVTEVMLDGDLLTEGVDYEVNREWLLYRTPDPVTNDARHWPCCQRLDLPLTEDHTFGVSFTYGAAPPSLGISAAKDLGCLMARERCSGESCRVSEQVSQLTSQGTTMAIIRPGDDLIQSLPRTVQMFLEAYQTNPKFRSTPQLVRPVNPRRGGLGRWGW